MSVQTSAAIEEQSKAAGGVNLPPELISDILSRLPAKTLGRFRCVSKHWQTLLSNPQFLATQFTRNNHQTKVIIYQDYSFLSFDFRMNCNSNSNPVAICETLSFKPTNPRFGICGSCNGLLLLYDYNNLELSIANPVTHESRQLPPFPESVCRQVCKFGFGYCSDDDEYTVVIISDDTCSSLVFMLKRNLWKMVENSPLCIDSEYGAFVNGAIHWLYSLDGDCSSGSTMIYAFDLAGERFREVEQQEGFKKEDEYFLDILGGCLCLIVHHENLAIDIWLMKEYGVRESWTKYVACFSQDYRNIYPLFFWNGDESIVAADTGRLVFCCFKKEILESIPVIGEQTREQFGSCMWTFVESLFSPNTSNAVDGSIPV